MTCDKGREKACLREIEDLLNDELGLNGDEFPVETPGNDTSGSVDNEGKPQVPLESAADSNASIKQESSGGIEDEIQKELAELAENDIVGAKRKRGTSDANGHVLDSASVSKKPHLELITLDIPCVSFVKFPSGKGYDPVAVVENLCQQAKAHPEKQKSRYVKKLTPLSGVRKVMSDGIEELCQLLLPDIFGGDDGKGWKYAVRLNVRNNNKVVKDDIIRTVAGKVEELGRRTDGDQAEGNPKSRHKVDLKGYEKLVLVEVYRNIVGMAVVDDQFEVLRRFNLAEIYADGRKAQDEDASAEQQ